MPALLKLRAGCFAEAADMAVLLQLSTCFGMMNAGSISVIIRGTAGAAIREDGVIDLRPVKSRRLRSTWNSEKESRQEVYDDKTGNQVRSREDDCGTVLLPGAEGRG